MFVKRLFLVKIVSYLRTFIYILRDRTVVNKDIYLLKFKFISIFNNFLIYIIY